ncbi:MAG: sigma54 specific transcriptional regulator, Fis family [Bryobacterales bacterium]|nr:sigma54 specific transcriptional regulator, Fis family [Bryobacterales bacterium]
MKRGALQALQIGADGVDLPPEWLVDRALTAAEGIDRLGNVDYDVAIVATPVPDAPVDDLLERLLSLRRSVPVVICDASALVADAVRYMQLGAYDVAGPDDDAIAKIQAAADACRSRPADDVSEPWRQMLVGTSPAIMRTLDVIRLVAKRRSTVLITGETGTGKEVVARALHLASPRSQFPMVAVNVAALPETLLEAELFGHVKGAFTGASQQRIGRCEQANRSTLFLDEIGDLPLGVQTKLLRFLQEREFQRVGSSETVRVDVRMIVAANVNLLDLVRQGMFREDLYYRLSVVPITVPPLRDRPEDIPLLANHFIERVCRQETIAQRRLAPATLAKLRAFSWPGNVRQLENAVEMAIAFSGERELLIPSDFTLAGPALPISALQSIAVSGTGLNFEQTVGRIERQIIEEALRKARGNKTVAAGMLGLKRTTLSAKLRSLSASAG